MIKDSRVVQTSTFRRYLIYMIILLSLSITWAGICFLHFKSSPVADNIRTFTAFSNEFDGYAKFDPIWRHRIFSAYLANLFVRENSDLASLAKVAGWWYGFWFILSGLLYMMCEKRLWLVLIFGTFAALCYGLAPPSGYRIYPWDMPAFFFYCLLYVISRYRLSMLTVLIIILGSGFKETISICAIIFLFWESLSAKKRVWLAGTTVAGCVCLRLLIDAFTDGHATYYFMSMINEAPARLLYNIDALVSPMLFHPIFINAGTLIILFLLPSKDRDDLMWKSVAVLFSLGIMLGGSITEYRIFWEMIPLSISRIANEWTGAASEARQ